MLSRASGPPLHTPAAAAADGSWNRPSEALERRGHVAQDVSEPEAEQEVLDNIQDSFFDTADPFEVCRQQLQVRKW